jgi:hypothetical protein
MSDPINFEIEELVARYELHPERRDVFVEGESDQGLVRAYLEHVRCHHVAVLSVAVVNLPAWLILAKGLPHPSRRSEVFTLAMELETRKVASQQAVCIADADFEYLLPQGVKCALLLLTDYASMELYAFSNEAVHSVLLIVAPQTKLTGTSLLADLSGPLQFLFSVRAANYNLQMGLAWIEAIDKFFSVQGERLDFDQDEFLKRYVLDRVSRNLADKFLAELTRIQSLLTSDIRCRIHGHDFIKILTWYLRTAEKCKHLTGGSVGQMLFVTIRLNELTAQPMFAALRTRVAV